ncbi:MAG: toxin-antitoxin system HicB family antitoxin [Nitrosopumilus sp.]|nr:toxin-antitoxin system HicB family antitoxin [Nitrosopumilus sp.]
MTKTISARISDELHKDILERANTNGQTINDYIIETLQNKQPAKLKPIITLIQ